MERDPSERRAETIKADTHDTIDEVKERVKAGGEKLDRAVQGGAMPLNEKLGSHVREAGHEIKADIDRSKRQARDDEAQEEGI